MKTLSIVGRPNVGKSALFNRLAGRRIAIVHDMPGVTRDRIAAVCKKTVEPINIMDTGGIGASLDDGFAAQVRVEAEIAMEASDAILFVVDAREGSHPIDATLAEMLRKSDKPVLVAINKADSPNFDSMDAEFRHLGLPVAAHVSAEHDRGFPALCGAINEVLELEKKEPELAEDEETKKMRPLRIALVGRPNVGKSSLINAILEDERTMVSDIAGTTRDSVDIPYERKGREYTLIDTAGIRRKQRRPDAVEVFSIVRAEKAIRRADLCALVIDATAGVASQDRKIARIIQKERKPCLIVLNKFDLYHPEGSFTDRWEQLKEEAGPELFFLDYAPMVTVSAKHGHYLKRFFQATNRIIDTDYSALTTGTLNRLLAEAVDRNPPPMKLGRRFNLLYAVWKKGVEDRPLPLAHFLLFANREGLLPASYKRYLENSIRAEYPFEGIPVSFDMRNKT